MTPWLTKDRFRIFFVSLSLMKINTVKFLALKQMSFGVTNKKSDFLLTGPVNGPLHFCWGTPKYSVALLTSNMRKEDCWGHDNVMRHLIFIVFKWPCCPNQHACFFTTIETSVFLETLPAEVQGNTGFLPFVSGPLCLPTAVTELPRVCCRVNQTGKYIPGALCYFCPLEGLSIFFSPCLITGERLMTMFLRH